MKRALVIEDNVDNMKLITFILEKSGFTTISAENGKKGIELALKERPDFILLDIQLPDMDGIKVLKVIRESHALDQTPVIAITSYAMSGDRERFVANGCNGYIEKPINPETILSEINQVIGGRS
jgi:two-component system cell cycle response regulator DivK